MTILGTSFAFVHLDETLGAARFALPEGSRIMQTGGFKGRSRELAPVAMRGMLSARYGVADVAIVAEYGMTELSSQMYETTLRAPDEPRRLWVPGWVRATPVDPETLLPVADGEVGILRIDDVANVDTVCAIQTADLARRIEFVIKLLSSAVFAVLAWQSHRAALGAIEFLEATDTKNIPHAPFLWIIALGSLLYCLVLALEATILATSGSIPGIDAPRPSPED